MSRKTSKQPRQRERWRAYGLLLPLERMYQKGRRGALWQEPADTSARETIIRAHLARGRTLADAGVELILRGFDPAKPDIVRAWLLDYCDRFIHMAGLRARNQHAIGVDPSDTVGQRAHITRGVRTFADLRTAQSPAARNTLTDMVLLANGLTPAHPHGGTVYPRSDPFDWRRLRSLVATSTDMRLMQCLARAREQAVVDAATYAPQYQAMLGISPQNIARALLPGHICHWGHSVAEAMLPRATLGQLDPLWSNPDPAWAGPAFLQTLSDGLPVMAAWLREGGW